MSWSPEEMINALQQSLQDTFTLALVANENDRSHSLWAGRPGLQRGISGTVARESLLSLT